MLTIEAEGKSKSNANANANDIDPKPKFANTIDFVAASKAWRANKKRVGNMYTYRCVYVHTNGKRCHKAIRSTTTITTTNVGDFDPVREREEACGGTAISMSATAQAQAQAQGATEPNVFCKQHARRKRQPHFVW